LGLETKKTLIQISAKPFGQSLVREGDTAFGLFDLSAFHAEGDLAVHGLHDLRDVFPIDHALAACTGTESGAAKLRVPQAKRMVAIRLTVISVWKSIIWKCSLGLLDPFENGAAK
jgi:hypothetical protein